jgi:hypothetical protein
VAQDIVQRLLQCGTAPIQPRGEAPFPASPFKVNLQLIRLARSLVSISEAVTEPEIQG